MNEMGIRTAVQHLIERCPLPMLLTDGKEHVVANANPAFCRLCGKPKEALVGKAATDVLPACGRDGVLPALLDRVYRTGEAEVVADLAHAAPGHGTVYWSYAVWSVPGGMEQPVGLMIQVADTTVDVAHRQGRERADAELREVNQALLVASVQQHELAEEATEAGERIRAQETQSRQEAVLEERNRIAREIHDTMAQAFTAIVLHLRVALRIVRERPEEARGLIEHVVEVAEHALAEARRSVWSLQPDAEGYRDLVGALSRVIERVSPGVNADLQLYVSGIPRPVPPDRGMNLARIGEEALNNALVHGHAGIVWFYLAFEPDRLLLRVQDDGKGFDPTRQDGGGFGLISMRQRAERLGGTVAIASKPGCGTEVAVAVPLSSATAEGGE